MDIQVTNYQCPACTGPLHFEGSSGKLECEYCGSAFDVAEIEAMFEEKEEKAAEAMEKGASWSDEEAAGMKTYTCPSCGAEILCDETTAATACVYCGNPTVVPGQFSGGLKPDYVVPFKLDKEQAEAALKGFYKGKKFLPTAFSSENHISEIKGVYVPFWLSSGHVSCSANYDASNSRHYTQGDYKVTETMHYKVHRAGEFDFEKIPTDASTKMPDGHMDSIEPYDYSELKPFSTAYLPGFLAEKYDVTREESKGRVLERVKGSASDLLRETVTSYDSVSEQSCNVQMEQGETSYALMPAWMLHTKYREKDYLFAMNGQTGKLVGDLPVSKGKFAAWFAGIAIPLMVILALFELHVGVIVGVPLLIALVVCLIFLGQMKTARVAREAGNYISGLDLKVKRDHYTHTTKERRKIEKDKASD